MSILTSAFKKITGSNEGEVNKLRSLVEDVNGLEPEFEKLSAGELEQTTAELKDLISEGKSLDDLLPDAFAAVREASKRTIGIRHYDVQLLGGIVLHQGKIAEMKTGEGRRWWPHCLSTSTLWKARARIWSLSTITWRNATPSGWGLYSILWAECGLSAA